MLNGSCPSIGRSALCWPGLDARRRLGLCTSAQQRSANSDIPRQATFAGVVGFCQPAAPMYRYGRGNAATIGSAGILPAIGLAGVLGELGVE